MSPLAILILSDGRPGHYHLAEGIAAAIGRRRPVAVTRQEIAKRGFVPGRLLARLLGIVAPAAVLRLGYGLDAAALPKAGLVISAGGQTLPANVAAARHLGAANIYCGTSKHVGDDAVSLVVTSYDRFRDRPRHLVALKPSGIDPDALARSATPAAIAPDRPPRFAGLLVGGDSGFFRYTEDEWRRLAALIGACHAAWGTRWIVSTSRRTADAVADDLVRLAARPDGPIAELIDFRTAGPGTLPSLFASVDAVVVTEDSSTMISEAVCARLPVVGVAPAHHAFKDEEGEYRAFMRRAGWCRFLPLATAEPATVLAALAEVRPLADNHLDTLADALSARLPGLFTPAA